MPPAYTLDQGEIVADSGDVTARVRVDCASPSALVVRGSDVYVACGDERLTYTTAADVMRPALVDRERVSCSELDPRGRCRNAPEVVAVNRTGPATTTRLERRTGLGWTIIGVSLGIALVLELEALGEHILAYSCDSPARCDEREIAVALDVASVVIAVIGPIAGIVVAGTSHYVTRKITMAPSIKALPGGGMLGLRVVF